MSALMPLGRWLCLPHDDNGHCSLWLMQMGDLVTSVLNANIHTYASAPAFILMELELIRRLAELVGYDGAVADGVFNPGGSFSNYLSMMIARQKLLPHVKKEGYRPTDRPVVFTSTHAHYSIKLGAMVRTCW